eukprot:5890600-Pyramimonas_sp.AAC.1
MVNLSAQTMPVQNPRTQEPHAPAHCWAADAIRTCWSLTTQAAPAPPAVTSIPARCFEHAIRVCSELATIRETK